MQPGVEKLPEWIQALAGLALLGIIMLGGWWLQQKEKKDRALERQRMMEMRSPENQDPKPS